MSQELFTQLFLGERGKTLTQTKHVTENKTPYREYREHDLHVVKPSDQPHSHSERTPATYNRPSLVRSTSQDDTSLGF